MNERTIVWFAVISLACAAAADVYVSNFTALNGSVGASGVWRNQTTLADLAIPVSLAQTGGEVKPTDHPSQPSRINNSFPWRDLPLPPFTNFFEPNFDGDFINIESKGGATVTVTIEFNTRIVDPILSFSDVDVQSTLVFAHPFTVIAQSGNMAVTGNSLTSSGVTIPFFGEETFGSIRFSGSFTSLTFTIVNSGPNPDIDDDRTGFVVATLTEPEPLEEEDRAIDLSIDGNVIRLIWKARFRAIEYATTLDDEEEWEPVPGLDPENETSWSGPIEDFGPRCFFRGVYDP